MTIQSDTSNAESGMCKPHNSYTLAQLFFHLWASTRYYSTSIQHLSTFFFSFFCNLLYYLVSMLGDFVAPTDSGVYDEEVRVTKPSITTLQPYPEACYYQLFRRPACFYAIFAVAYSISTSISLLTVI